MKLVIENFAKIKHAEITVDGLTVITGNNNSGKSTVGKVLYAMFNSLYDLEHKIENRREREILTICYDHIRNLKLYNKKEKKSLDWNKYGPIRRIYDPIIKDIIKALLEVKAQTFNKALYTDILYDAFEKFDMSFEENDFEEFVNATYENIEVRLKNDNHKIGSEVISRYFTQIFTSQIQCLKNPDITAKVHLTLNNKNGSIVFENNVCSEWHADYNVLHEAVLIDNPFVLDEVTDYFYSNASLSTGVRSELVRRLQERLRNAENDVMKGLFEAVSAKENLKEIYEILNKVTQGDIAYQNGQWGLKTKAFVDSIYFENLSAGLKSFVLIKILLEKGILKEKDVLILDEPEIHLHPEWQLIYAEIIVLLLKKFDLSIVVTTHSAHFLEAIEYFSRKHATTERCKYYIANVENELATFDDVTESIDKIYRQMVTPSMLLDQLKYEMDSNNE